jgi:hypothetical protein
MTHILPHTSTSISIFFAFGIIIIGIIFLIIFNTISKYIAQTFEKSVPVDNLSDDELTYFKCAGKTLNDATIKGLDNTKFKKGVSADSSELYIPCDYNYIEIELAKLNPSEKTKYIYAIKGCDSLCGKDSLWRILDLVYGTDEASKIMPQTWIITDLEENDELDSELEIYYKTNRMANPAFILKKNIQGKRGLKIADSLDMIYEIVSYDSAYKVAQLYIKNCYVINNRKLNIRLYVVISCFRKHIQWFLYNHGKCIYTNKKYDPVHSFIDTNINDKEQHFTSYNLNTNQVYNIEKLPETLQDLAVYIDSTMPSNITYDKLWVSICSKLSMIKHAFAGSLCNLETLDEQICFQLFGIDVIIDSDTMEPYILELNKGPEMTYKSPGDTTLKPQLITDMLNMITNKKGVTESNFTVIT